MVRLNIKTGKIIEEQELRDEDELQGYVEKYLYDFFQSYLLKSFYDIPGGQIDSLAITEDGVPCIIEYKHKNDQNVINQIIFYYDWLVNKINKSQFEQIVRENKQTKKLKIDWTKIRLICIARDYGKWDISLAKHLDTELECYNYKYHKNELDLSLDPSINKNKKPKSISVGTKEITLQTHQNKANEKGKKLLETLRSEVLKLGNDVNEGFTPEYIKYYVDTTFLALHVRKEKLILHLKINEKTFKDPKKLTTDITSRGWSVTRELKMDSIEQLSEVMDLVKQAYSTQKQS